MANMKMHELLLLLLGGFIISARAISLRGAVTKAASANWSGNSSEAFNGTIGDWDTSNVTSMVGIFSGLSTFNEDISRWDTSSVTDMTSMFNGATAFNTSISGWDTSSVTDMSHMFIDADNFNQDISGWVTSNVTTMQSMFARTAFNQDISGWDTSSVTDMTNMFLRNGFFNYTNACMCAWELRVDASVLAGLDFQTCYFTTLDDANFAYSQSAKVVRAQADQIAVHADQIADLLYAMSTISQFCLI
jgi:surface protein